MKPDPIIFELLAVRPVRVVLLLLFFLAVTLTLSYARAEEAGITARIGALQEEVQRLELQVGWLIAHARSQETAISQLTAVVDSQNALITQLKQQNQDAQAEPPHRLQIFRKTRYGWNANQ